MKRYIKCKLDTSNIDEKYLNGDCFVQAFRNFMASPHNRVLVHGVVTGKGALDGVQYTHAWVEEGDNVIDTTMPEWFQNVPTYVFYSVGNVSITRKYEINQVFEMVDKFGTYGPWDSIFDDYMYD